MEGPENIIMPIFLSFGLSMSLNMFLFDWMFRDARGASYRIMGRSGVGKLKHVPYWLRFCLPIQKWRLSATIGLALLSGILILTFANGGWTFFALPSLVLGLLMTMLSFRVASENLDQQFQIELANIAAARISRRVDPEAATAALSEFAASGKVDFQLIAAKYLGRIGTASAIAELQRLSQSDEVLVQSAAQNALEAIESIRLEKFGNNLSGLPKLLSSYRQFLRPVYSKVHDKHLMDGEALAQLEEQIDQLLFPQITLKASFPHVFCTQCKRRGHEQAQLGWWWLTCKACDKASSLILDVKQVVGQIGGDAKLRFEAGEYKISIWDDKSKVALPAEIDVLEIVDGHAIDYDWAVSCVVAMIGNHFPDRMGKLELRIRSGSFLEANSVALLKQLGSMNDR